MKFFFSGLAAFLALLMPSSEVGFSQQTQPSSMQLEIFPSVGRGTAEFKLVFKNTGESPLVLEFPTSQVYEIIVNKETGEEVYRYSEGRSFLQAIQTIKLKPGESKKWIEKWDYQKNSAVVPGEYSVTAFLNLYQINGEKVIKGGKFRATSKFSIPVENPTFRNVKTEGAKGNYIVSGEVRSKTGQFYYSVEDGHNEVVPETPISANGSEWIPFKIELHIPKEKLPVQGTLILNLFENKESVSAYPVVLDRF